MGGAEDHGDPFALRHRGEYFLFHTTDDGDAPISAHRSLDLVHWERAAPALAPAGWAQTDLWAPEVIHVDGEFLMYVSATTMGPDGEGVEADRRQGLARSRTPLGPYIWDPEPLVRDVWSIDGHPFRASDGTRWLFYNVRTEATRFRGHGGSGNVVDRLLAPDRLAGDPVPVAFPSRDWEGNAAGDAFWNEGAWVIERRHRLYQMYSGGFYREPTYGIGVATASAPRGPWEKHPDDPLLRSGDRITGPGHHCVVVAPDGVTPYAVYHAYDGDRPGRKVHLDRLFWVGDRPAIGSGRPTEGVQPLPPGPVYDPAVPHWHAELADGRRVRSSGLAPPEHALTLTSQLEDERVHGLAPGDPLRVAWGGAGRLEISVAVRGGARLRAGAADERVRSAGWTLLRATAPGGAQEVVIEGDGEVTDLVLSAR